MAAKKVLDIVAMLSAQDRMSKTINAAFDNAQKRMTAFQKNADKFASRSFQMARNTGQMGAAIGAPIAFAVNEAVKFEDQMADVAKVLNLKVGSEGLNAVGDDVRRLSITLARTPDQVAGLYASLAQGGVAQQDLNRIAENAGKVGIAFDIATDVAGEKFIKIQNALNITTTATEGLMNSINYLSDNTAAKAPEILEFFAAGGAGATKLLNVSPQAGAAMGSFFISMGKSASESATIIERFSKGLRNADSEAGRIFNQSGGGMDGVLAVIERGRALKGSAQFNFFKQFGQYGTEVMQMANNFDNFQNVLGLATDVTAQAGSVNAEFANRMSTTATMGRQMRIELIDMAIELGNSFLPVLKDIFESVKPIITGMKNWIVANPKLTATITKVVAITSVLLLSMSGIGFLMGGVAKFMSIGAGAFKMLAAGIQFAIAATRALTIAAMANPYVALATGIVIAAALIIKYWEPIKEFFVNLWSSVTESFNNAWIYITGIGRKMYDAGANIMKSIWEGMKATVSYPINAMKDMVTKIRDYLPFSPAKIGPLRDLGNVKISETIATAIRPFPIANAMSNAVQPIASGVSSAGSGPGSSGVNINFAPTINFAGAGGESSKSELMDVLRKYGRELVDLVRTEMRNEDRLSF